MKTTSPAMLDRTSPGEASRVFFALARDKGAREQILRRLRASILAAHRENPACWGITLFADRIRLNVGWNEVLVLRQSCLLIYEGSQTERQMPVGIRTEPGGYKRLSTAQAASFSCERLPEAYDFLQFGHERAIKLLATTPPRAIRLAHSPGVLRYIETALALAMPDPAWAEFADVPLPREPDLDFVESATGVEGRRRWVFHLRRERDPRLVQAAKAVWKNRDPLLACEVCGFSFARSYGNDLAQDYIEAHHRVPLSEISEAATIAIHDLVPVCANCHRMLHRTPEVTVDALTQMLNTRRPEPF